jgi:response regulator RpfG family c-di-GMP phosphodiesterase
MLFKKQASLSQSGRQVRHSIVAILNTYLKHPIQDPRISARNKLLVRRLEHEQLEKRLRRAELEKEVLSAELQASAKRVEEAQRLETATPPTPNSHEYPFPVAIYERPTLRDSYRDVQAPSIANGNIEG